MSREQIDAFDLDSPDWIPAIRDALEELIDTDDYSDDQLEHIAVLMNQVYVAGYGAGQARSLGEFDPAKKALG
jgi:hypothetical protein